MAGQAPTQAIGKIHLQLAERYEALADEFDERSNSAGSSPSKHRMKAARKYLPERPGWPMALPNYLTLDQV
jgi:hypothetical protein